MSFLLVRNTPATRWTHIFCCCCQRQTNPLSASSQKHVNVWKGNACVSSLPEPWVLLQAHNSLCHKRMRADFELKLSGGQSTVACTLQLHRALATHKESRGRPDDGATKQCTKWAKSHPVVVPELYTLWVIYKLLLASAEGKLRGAFSVQHEMDVGTHKVKSLSVTYNEAVRICFTSCKHNSGPCPYYSKTKASLKYAKTLPAQKTTPNHMLSKAQGSIQTSSPNGGLLHANKHFWITLTHLLIGKMGLDELNNINNQISTSITIFKKSILTLKALGFHWHSFRDLVLANYNQKQKQTCFPGSWRDGSAV